MQRSIKERNIKDRIIKDRVIKERHHRAGRNIGEGNLVAQIEMLASWFHNLHFSGDIQTAPVHFLGDVPLYKWLAIEHRIASDPTNWWAPTIPVSKLGIEAIVRSAGFGDIKKISHEIYLATALNSIPDFVSTELRTVIR
jgi:hypothetical protein